MTDLDKSMLNFGVMNSIRLGVSDVIVPADMLLRLFSASDVPVPVETMLRLLGPDSDAAKYAAAHKQEKSK